MNIVFGVAYFCLFSIILVIANVLGYFDWGRAIQLLNFYACN
jgi:hypothetical protein